MDKKVKPYKQRGDTCAIVCMLMVLEYYKIIVKANWYDERRLYKIYRSKYMAGTPFAALAFHLAKNGLETTIWHEDKDLFNNKREVIANDAFKLAMDEYKTYLECAVSKGANVICGIDITVELLKQKLREDNLVILAGKLQNCYHAILIVGYDNDSFFVCDPLYKEKQIRTSEEIKKFMNTDIGKWFISVNDRKRR